MKAREEGLSQWEEVLKGQAKEANQGASKVEADLAAQENSLRERSDALEAEQRKVDEARLGLEEREKAVADREVELAGLEEGREARFMELERVREKLALMEKGLETERVDLGERKVRGSGRGSVCCGSGACGGCCRCNAVTAQLCIRYS